MNFSLAVSFSPFMKLNKSDARLPHKRDTRRCDLDIVAVVCGSQVLPYLWALSQQLQAKITRGELFFYLPVQLTDGVMSKNDKNANGAPLNNLLLTR